MSAHLEIYLLDKSNNIIEEINLIRPNSFEELISNLKYNLKKLPKYYKIYNISEKNEEIIINNNEQYSIVKDILFIREIEHIHNNNLKQSIFERNYNKLPESKQLLLDEKYNCFICSMSIKNEKPLFCYICQKIFHEKCLVSWDTKRKSQNEKFTCPNCRSDFPLEKWKKKLDYEDNRKNEAENMNLINKLKSYINKQNYIIKKYNDYIEKTFDIFKNVLKKLEIIKSFLNVKNDKLKNIIKQFPLNKDNLDIDFISQTIFKELEKVEYYITNPQYNNIKLESSNIIKKSNYQTNNQIKLIYYAEHANIYDIFGEKFVSNNINNIKLIINGENQNLVNKCKLNKGENSIELIIKRNLTNLEDMFYNISTFKNLGELNYLDTKNVINLSNMFYGCSSLSDIKFVESWDVSNVKDFSYMFDGCSSLRDITALKNWNVSNGNNFSDMFNGCTSLTDLKSLKYWNVSNGDNFSDMFNGCTSLKDIKYLANWNVSNGHYFSLMFYGCTSLSDVSPLIKWNVSNEANFSSMFLGCSI